MSLINDALKRVKQARQKPPTPAAPDAPLEPVQTDPSPRSLAKLVIPVCVLLVALAGWFLWQWWTGHPREVKAASSTSAATNKALTATKVTTNIISATSKSPSPSEPQVSTASALQTNVGATAIKTSVAAEVAQSATTNPPAEKPSNGANTARADTETNLLASLSSQRNVNFPPLRLQGIYYRMAKPSVLINNRTLFLNDEIEGVRVVGIERRSVKLEIGGRTKELMLK